MESVTSTCSTSSLFINTSLTSIVWYPTKENVKVYSPGSKSNEYFPSKSVVVPIVDPFTITLANAIGSSYSPSIISPVTLPDCEYISDVNKINIKFRRGFFIFSMFKKSAGILYIPAQSYSITEVFTLSKLIGYVNKLLPS